MTTAETLAEDRLGEIDGLRLSERVLRLRDAMLSAPRRISVDRMKLAMESWRECSGCSRFSKSVRTARPAS